MQECWLEPDGCFLLTTYVALAPDEFDSITGVRFRLEELDELKRATQ